MHLEQEDLDVANSVAEVCGKSEFSWSERANESTDFSFLIILYWGLLGYDKLDLCSRSISPDSEEPHGPSVLVI